MGSSTSKAVQKGARRFPTRAPGTAIPPSPAPAQQVKLERGLLGGEPRQPGPAPESAADDPDSLPTAEFAERLRRMGIVQPNPTFSPSSTAGHAGRFPPAGRQGAGSGGQDSSKSPPAIPSSPSSPFPNPLPSSSSPPQPQPQPLPPSNREVLGGAPPPPRFAPAAGNATLAALEARRRLQERVEAGARGEFASARTIRDALVLRRKGVPAADVERRLGLRQGLLERLGEGVVVALEEGHGKAGGGR